MKNKTSCKGEHFGSELLPDYITTLYQKKMAHILDMIFLALPKNDILVCQSVSLSWCQIVERYQKSKNCRIQRILNFKIEEEWRKGNAAWRTGVVPLTEAYNVKSFIADKDHIAIAADNYGGDLWWKMPSVLKIIILDSKTLQLCKVLLVKEETGAYMQWQIKLALNDKYLVAYCCSYNSYKYYSSDSYYYIWNRGRDGNFSPHPLQIKTNCLFSVKDDCHWIEMPCLKNRKLTSVIEVQTPNSSPTFVFHEWDLLYNRKQQPIHLQHCNN